MKNKSPERELVICFSTASMKAEIWTNKQHLMSRLSKRPGYDVIYIDQGMSSREFKKAVRQQDWGYFLKPFRKFNDHLWVLSPFFLPLIKGGNIKKLSWKLLYRIISGRIDFNEYDRVIVWAYQPQSWYFIREMDWKGKNHLIIYDCVDDFKSQPFYSYHPDRKKELLLIEEELVKKADIVTTTSKKLYDDKKVFNKSSYYIHNVGDFDHFNKTGVPSEEFQFLESISAKKIVYAGVIDDYKIDLELIDTITDRLNYYFVFLGPVRVKEKKELLKKLQGKNNVHFHGHVDYKILPSVLHQCDTIWLPYNKNDHTQYVFPLKLFEAFATGKQVVARSLNSYEKYSDYMQVFNNADEAVSNLALEINKARALKRISLAKENDWDSRLDKILNLLKLKNNNEK